ncbi:ABC-2 family transporter protein [Paenibacillus oryzisoli]|uniref:ABC transporter permease n=1 Tax=Paenibacillus oryzisoli TaxID=1850517 RepID=UPI003D28FEBF
MLTEVDFSQSARAYESISLYGKPGRWRRLLFFVWGCWKANLLGAMEFRLSFLLTAGTMLINNVVWIVFWGLYFRRFPVVNGWELQDVMMLWAVGAGGFGLMATLFGNATRIASLIANGQLDVYLAQPKPVLLHILLSRMSVSAIGDVAFALLVYAFFGDHSLLGVLKFGLALTLATLIFIFFTVIVNCLAFWLGNTEGLSFQLFNALLTFSTYPTGIFRGAGKLLLFTVIPAGFISYLPIGLLRSLDTKFILGAIGVVVFLSAVGIGLFYTGLRRYASGNMMGLRR